MNNKNVVTYIKQFYPTTSTDAVASALQLTNSQIRTLAKNNGIKKCEKYKQELKQQLIINRRKWYEENIPAFEPSHFQEQIIFGSLLGDGYISQGAQRSINYYYQEHFGEGQRTYREWKLSKLYNLGFTISGNYLRSRSHPYFNKIYSILYPGGIKSLNQKFIAKCTHPIFLTSLYLDDGSLTISYTYNKKTNTVYCHPSIILYTLNLTKPENELLATHLNTKFKTNFVVSGHPHGHNSLLKVNKEKEVRQLLNIIAPYTKAIPSMKYKTNIKENIQLKKDEIQGKFGKDVHIVFSSSNRNRAYSEREINRIIELKTAGVTNQAIANEVGRTYWAIVYKLSELRKLGLLGRTD